MTVKAMRCFIRRKSLAAGGKRLSAADLIAASGSDSASNCAIRWSHPYRRDHPAWPKQGHMMSVLRSARQWPDSLSLLCLSDASEPPARNQSFCRQHNPCWPAWSMNHLLYTVPMRIGYSAILRCFRLTSAFPSRSCSKSFEICHGCNHNICF